MTTVPEIYERWAIVGAYGSSPLYQSWALAIVADPEIQQLIATLPPGKRQPVLVFAAARAAGAPLGPYEDLRPWLLAYWPEVARIALERRTQTNEAARCATLLPELSRIESPLALLEVGSSAGLCLYPDRYSYRYRTPDGSVSALDPGEGPSEVVIDCDIDAAAVPERLPEVRWRAGIDLNPLDVTDEADRTWLRTLIWPEHTERRARLEAACDVVAADPPRLVRGDLLDHVAGVAAGAPADAHLVVFHVATLGYLSPERRAEFVDVVTALDATWLSIEQSTVFPRIAAPVSGAGRDGRLLVARDGTAVARAGVHGRDYETLPAPGH